MSTEFRTFNLILFFWLPAFALLFPLADPALAADGDAQAMSLLARYFKGQPYDVIIDGSRAYVGLDTGIHVFDVGNPAAIVELDHFYLPSPAFQIALENNLLFVANGESGLAILDVQDPSDLILRGSLSTGSVSFGVCVLNDVAYLAEVGLTPAGDRLRIVDVGTPSAPVESGILSLGKGPLSV